MYVGFVHMTVQVWKSEDHLQDSVLIFYYVGSGMEFRSSGW